MFKIIVNLLHDEKGSSPTVAVKSIVLISFFLLLIFVIIEFFYMSYVYSYLKNQQDLANRAVYAELDVIRLADRELYIDENLGRDKFEEYLIRNLELDTSNKPGRPIQIVGSIIIKDFEIYNLDELPTTTPSGKTVNLVSVYSEIEVEVVPFLIRYGTIKISPHLVTDIPDILVNTFHPSI